MTLDDHEWPLHTPLHHTNVKCQKTYFIGGAVCREFELEAPAAEEMLERMVVELFVTEDREFQTAGSVMLLFLQRMQ